MGATPSFRLSGHVVGDQTSFGRNDQNRSEYFCCSRKISTRGKTRLVVVLRRRRSRLDRSDVSVLSALFHPTVQHNDRKQYEERGFEPTLNDYSRRHDRKYLHERFAVSRSRLSRTIGDERLAFPFSGLFEKDKLVFSFLLCAEILKLEGAIDEAEWNFLLRGGLITDQVTSRILDLRSSTFLFD